MFYKKYEDWPYWLKTGLILGFVYFVIHLETLILRKEFLIDFFYFDIPTVFVAPFIYTFVDFFFRLFGFSFFNFYYPAKITFLIVATIQWSLLGMIIGWIYENIKYKMYK